MKKLMVCSLYIALLLASADARAGHDHLTAIFTFSCDPDGNPAGNFGWDTRGLDSDYYKVFIADGVPGGDPDGLTDDLINGPTWAEVPINLRLKKGEHHFTLFFQANGPWTDHFGMNLFFNGGLLPAISVKAPLRTSEVVPPFAPNSAPLTYTMTSYPFPDGPAAGTLSVDLQRHIQLTNFYVADTTLFNVDRIDTHGAGPNGRTDFVATFTLVVGQ